MCVVHLRERISPQAKKPKAQMMSCEFPCSARSHSPVEECNLHHTPRRSTRPFNQRIFPGASPLLTCLGPVRDAPRHLGFEMDPGGESDACAILSQKQNIIFNFLRFRALHAARLRHGGGQEWCQNDLTHRRADFDPICQPSQRYSTSLLVKCADHREGAHVREMHRCNWTWNVISLPATKVQADWGPVITDSHLLFGDTWTRIINTARDDAKSIWLTARICAPLAPPTVFHYGDIWARVRFLTNPCEQKHIWSASCVLLCSIVRCSMGKEPSQKQKHTPVMDSPTGLIGTREDRAQTSQGFLFNEKDSCFYTI